MPTLTGAVQTVRGQEESDEEPEPFQAPTKPMQRTVTRHTKCVRPAEQIDHNLLSHTNTLDGATCKFLPTARIDESTLWLKRPQTAAMRAWATCLFRVSRYRIDSERQADVFLVRTTKHSDGGAAASTV